MSNVARKTRTKDLISLALYRIMLKKPYEEISVKDICKKAGVSRMSFYRYFNVKDDIFIDYCDERFEEFYDSFVEKYSEPNMKDLILEIFTFIKKYSRQIEILRRAQKLELLVEQFSHYLKYLASKFPLITFFQDDANKINQYSIAFFSGGLFRLCMFWSLNGCQESPEEMTENLLNHFETGINGSIYAKN